MSVKYMSIMEFYQLGLLQELNRQFLHPMGLALEIVLDADKGEAQLNGIWDCREDPEGIAFAEEMLQDPQFKEKADRVAKMLEEKRAVRETELGFHIQPVK